MVLPSDSTSRTQPQSPTPFLVILSTYYTALVAINLLPAVLLAPFTRKISPQAQIRTTTRDKRHQRGAAHNLRSKTLRNLPFSDHMVEARYCKEIESPDQRAQLLLQAAAIGHR